MAVGFAGGRPDRGKRDKMNQNKRRYGAGGRMLRFCMAVSLITGLFLTGCGKETETEQAAGPVTLTFWHYYNEIGRAHD